MLNSARAPLCSVPESVSPALATAVMAAALAVEVCSACAEPANLGLCHAFSCQLGVLPLEAPNAMNRDAHSGMYHETTPRAERERGRVKAPTPKRAPGKQKQRAQRKRARVNARRREAERAIPQLVAA